MEKGIRRNNHPIDTFSTPAQKILDAYQAAEIIRSSQGSRVQVVERRDGVTLRIGKEYDVSINSSEDLEF